MPVDPQAQVFLDEVAAMGAPSVCCLTLAEARAGAAASAVMLGAPEPVASIEDYRAAGPGGEIPLRVYRPCGDGPLPVYVYYHGGGWVVGGIATHEAHCCAVANAAGCIVVSVDYRLAPENKYPAAADDAFAATAWVFENAPGFGGDPARVAVGGDSAGGNLAAAVALMARDRGSFRPALQVLIYPVTDFRFDTPSYEQNAEGYMLSRSDMQWFWRCYLDAEEDGRQPYASPLRAVDLRGVAPALVITAEYDPLRDEGEAYAARLRQAGVSVELSRYHGMIHGFIRRTARFDQARAALAEVVEALREAFRRVES